MESFCPEDGRGLCGGVPLFSLDSRSLRGGENSAELGSCFVEIGRSYCLSLKLQICRTDPQDFRIVVLVCDAQKLCCKDPHPTLPFCLLSDTSAVSVPTVLHPTRKHWCKFFLSLRGRHTVVTPGYTCVSMKCCRLVRENLEKLVVNATGTQTAEVLNHYEILDGGGGGIVY